METFFTIYMVIGLLYTLISILTIWSDDFDSFLESQGEEAMTTKEKVLHLFSCLFFWPLHLYWMFK